MKTFNQTAIDHAVELDRLRAVNAELIDALQHFLSHCESAARFMNAGGILEVRIARIDALNKARAALAKATQS